MVKTIEITPEIAAKAEGYFSIRNCLMATAIREVMPKAVISVDGFRAFIDGECYRMTTWDSDRILMAYRGKRSKPVVKESFSVELFYENYN